MLAHTGGGRFSFWVLDARSMTRCSLGPAVPPRNRESAVHVPRPPRGWLQRGRGDLLGDDSPGEEILIGNGRRLCVLAVVPFEAEDESPFAGLLQVEVV